ncbi:protein RarD [Pilimelia terevasa]|uniref:Protein RarD n=1 Tax=Pilimelia terevasa TaxID=53372 RepID=A0A8J3FJA1_9ACTN|nr:protein RarD [Pilimelia terevasa]
MLAATGAYGVWGLLILYWPLLEPAPALEILAHRVVWSLVIVAVVLAVQRDLRWIRTLHRRPRQAALLAAAGCLVGANWGLYIWAINSGHVVEAALGYYINPLCSALLGLLALREKMTGAQWVGVGLVMVGVVWLAAGAGRPPWVAVGLAATFACYGLLRKWAAVPSWRALAVETLMLAAPAAAYLTFLAATGQSHFADSPAGALLLASTGLVTALPLALFGFATVRTPLVVMGMLQYLLPTVQFVIGYYWLREPVSPTEIGAYCFVWAGAAVSLVSYARRQVPRSRLADPPAPEQLSRADTSRWHPLEEKPAPALAPQGSVERRPRHTFDCRGE